MSVKLDLILKALETEISNFGQTDIYLIIQRYENIYIHPLIAGNP